MVVPKTEGIMAETLRERWLDWLVAVVLLGLFSLAVRGSIGAYSGTIFPTGWQPWWDGFLQNSGTEMLGAFMTFVLLELIRGRRERRYQEEADERRTKATQELVRGFIQAQELARLLAAQTPEERQPILESMKATGLLKGANLRGANLEGASLYRVNLQGAVLDSAVLQWADLGRANLQGTMLMGANLEGAILFEASLQGANLYHANLHGVNLYQANLQGAYLGGVNLQGAKGLAVKQLREVETLEGATLPDGRTLPGDDTWREAFEAWCETDEEG
jgi:hypothetical protein